MFFHRQGPENSLINAAITREPPRATLVLPVASIEIRVVFKRRWTPRKPAQQWELEMGQLSER